MIPAHRRHYSESHPHSPAQCALEIKISTLENSHKKRTEDPFVTPTRIVDEATLTEQSSSSGKEIELFDRLNLASDSSPTLGTEQAVERQKLEKRLRRAAEDYRERVGKARRFAQFSNLKALT